ncbi:MAG: glycosyltransferase family 2 protein [Candidatus Bathyarchaeia archaeon]
MSRADQTVVACIPAKDEEESIAQVMVKAMRYVGKVIVCDDGSKDLTGEIARRLGGVVVRHERSLGYGAALASLFDQALGENPSVVVTLDADGQHDPDGIPLLLAPILSGEADIVVGSRFLEKGDMAPSYRRLGVKAITKFSGGAAPLGLTDAQSGFRAYSRRALPVVKPTEMGMGASTEILLKAYEAGLRVVEVPIKVRYDRGGHSLNPVYHGVDVVLSTVKQWSIRHPLIFYGAPGLASLLVAAYFWFQTLEMFVRTRSVLTNVTLVAVAATLVGLMLMTTAVILWVVISVVRER